MKRLIFCLQSQKTKIHDNLFPAKAKGVILLLFIVSVSYYSYGQTVFELGSKLAEMKGSSDTTLIREAARIESLVYHLQPTIYIEENVLKAYGETPAVRVRVDAQSVGKLLESNPLFSQVELITITINSPADLNFSLNLTSLPGFTKLKYIHFLCSFNCAPESFINLYIPNPQVTVFYVVSIPF